MKIERPDLYDKYAFIYLLSKTLANINKYSTTPCDLF